MKWSLSIVGVECERGERPECHLVGMMITCQYSTQSDAAETVDATDYSRTEQARRYIMKRIHIKRTDIRRYRRDAVTSK